jgi:hypothetical protein
MRQTFVLLGIFALAACNRSDSDPGPVTVSEAQALDQAAQVLDQRQPSAGTLPAPLSTAPAPVASAAP